jgi:hypothetical protein
LKRSSKFSAPSQKWFHGHTKRLIIATRFTVLLFKLLVYCKSLGYVSVSYILLYLNKGEVYVCTRRFRKVKIHHLLSDREIFYAYCGNNAVDLDPLPVSRARLTVVEQALFE